MPQRATNGLAPWVPKDVAGAVNQMIGWPTTIRFDLVTAPPTINICYAQLYLTMRPDREPSKGWPASSLTETIDLYKPIGHGLGTDDFLGAEV